MAEENVPGGIVSSVKEMVEKSSDEIRERISSLKRYVDESYMEMAGLLHNISVEKKFMEWGFKTMQEYVEKELDFGYRKAQYLIGIWSYFGVEVGDPTVLEKVAGLGWPKVKELRNVVTKSNVDEWVEKAARLSAVELAAVIREARESGKRFVSPSIDSDDDAIQPEDVTESVGEVAPRNAMQFRFYDEQYKIVTDALALAREKGSTDVRSNQLSLICLEFLATNEKTGLTVKERVKTTFKQLADQFGVDIIVISGDEILLGRELIEQS